MQYKIEQMVNITDFAANKINNFIHDQSNNLDYKLRVYVSGGGCNGFQYGFILDEKICNDDYVIIKNGASIVIDPISLQYLSGGTVDYYEGLEGSKFVVINPNAKITCSCGASFNI